MTQLSPEWRELDAKAEIRAEVFKALAALERHLRERDLPVSKEVIVTLELAKWLSMNGRRNNAE